MILLTNKTLQYLIYNQLYSAGVYELLATQAPTEMLQTQMKVFQQDSLNNAYNPIVQEPVDQGTFKKNVYWMLEYEGTNTRLFVDESFNGQNDASIKSLTSYISSSIDRRNTKLTNIYLNILDNEIADNKKTSPK